MVRRGHQRVQPRFWLRSKRPKKTRKQVRRGESKPLRLSQKKVVTPQKRKIFYFCRAPPRRQKKAVPSASRRPRQAQEQESKICAACRALGPPKPPIKGVTVRSSPPEKPRKQDFFRVYMAPQTKRPSPPEKARKPKGNFRGRVAPKVRNPKVVVTSRSDERSA